MPTMKVIRLFGPRDLRLLELERPRPGPHQALCRVERVGICGTDYAIYSGAASFVKSGLVKFPMTLGHEWSGVVAEIGAGVENLAVGDRVVGDTVVACGYCPACLLGDYVRCRQARAVGTVNAWDGAYAEYILFPERHLFHLPAAVSFDNGALVEPAATALYAVKKAGVRLGDTALVQGSGPIGLLAAKLAKLAGAAKVLITGRKDAKLELALKFGVDGAINTTRETAAAGIKRHLGVDKVDRLIEASGSARLFSESLELINGGGAMAVVAFYDQPAQSFDLDKFVFSDVTLAAVPGSLGMYPPVLKMMAAGALAAAPLITERAPLSAILDILPDFKQGAKSETRVKVMLENENRS